MENNLTKENLYKKVLFINYGGIGDEILFLPAVQSFKKCYPESFITLCLEPRSKSIKDLTRDIDDVICVDIKAKGIKKYLNVAKMIMSVWNRGYDAVISSGKSPLVAVILFLTGIKTRIGYKTKTSFLLSHSVDLNESQYAGNMYHDLIVPICKECTDKPYIEPDKDYTLRQSLQGKNFIAVHPGVSKMSITKNIHKCPDKNFWINVIKGILNKNKTVVLLGGPDDKDIIDAILNDSYLSKNTKLIDMYLKTKNLKELANLLSFADYLICADSAPLHIGVALGINVISIFGPTNEKKLVPQGQNVRVVVNDEINCRPCLWHKRMHNCENSECLNIKVENVINLV